MWAKRLARDRRMAGANGFGTLAYRSWFGHERLPIAIAQHLAFVDQHDRNSIVDPIDPAGCGIGGNQPSINPFERCAGLRADQQIEEIGIEGRMVAHGDGIFSACRSFARDGRLW